MSPGLVFQSPSQMTSESRSQALDLSFEQLVECLEQQIKIYRSLLEVVRREKDILVSAQLDELNENNRSKDALLVRLRSLENTRMKCARDVAQNLGTDVEAPRLLDLALVLDANRSVRLRNIHSVLELLLKRVCDLNKENEFLVHSALGQIAGAMSSLRDSLAERPIYERKGGVHAPKGDAGHLVRRQA